METGIQIFSINKIFKQNRKNKKWIFKMEVLDIINKIIKKETRETSIKITQIFKNGTVK